MFEHFLTRLDESKQDLRVQIPPQKEARRLADGLFHFLFPILSSDHRPARVLYTLLRHDLENMLHPLLYPEGRRAEDVSDRFFKELPRIYDLLQEDASAIMQFDPAATCIEEVIASYPGFHAIAIYRIAHQLQVLEVPLLPRVFSEYIHGQTGIDIHPSASIGHSFFIDHGTGVVIGATAVIGNNVKIYQGVTLGAVQVDKSLSSVKRHPTIEDNCILYANSTILGGTTVIGHDSVIGGNTWLTESVPPYSIVLHQSQVKVRTKPFEEPVNFVI